MTPQLRTEQVAFQVEEGSFILEMRREGDAYSLSCEADGPCSEDSVLMARVVAGAALINVQALLRALQSEQDWSWEGEVAFSFEDVSPEWVLVDYFDAIAQIPRNSFLRFSAALLERYAELCRRMERSLPAEPGYSQAVARIAAKSG